MKIILLSIFIVVGAFFPPVFSQEKGGPPEKAKKGTYQFIVLNAKSTVTFSDEILIEIEKNRDEKVVKYLQLGSQAKVRILPREEIYSSDFKPVKEEVIYLNE